MIWSIKWHKKVFELTLFDSEELSLFSFGNMKLILIILIVACTKEVKLEQYIHIVLCEWTNQAGKTQKWIKQILMCPNNIAQMLEAQEK